MRAIGIIPSRLKSSRLPNKALVDIEGLPMIIHVLKRAQLAKKLDDVLVATDSQEIFAVVKKFGGRPVMTSDLHQTGTDRIAEVAQTLDTDIIVNIQGDEALLQPEHIDQALSAFEKDRAVQVAVLVAPYKKKNSGSDIKAVLDLQDFIMYCSRTDLPSSERTPVEVMWKMSFIVPFRKEFLLKYTSLPQTPLEKIEFNEYLRIVEHGYKIKAIRVDHTEISVDTPDDLRIVQEKMKSDKIKYQYMK